MTVWQHCLNTWRLTFKDKGAILLLFVAGLIYSFFYPLPYHYEQVESVPVIFIDQDQSTSSRSLRRLLIASPNIRIREISSDPSSIQSALWQGDAMALIIIPPGFHRDILAARTAEVQVSSHGGYLLAGSKALSNVSQAVLTMGAAISMHKLQSLGVSPNQAFDNVQPLQLHTRALYNPHNGYGHSIVPAVMVLVIQQTLLIGVTLILGRQAEQGLIPTGWRAYFGMWVTFTSIGLFNSLYFFVGALRLQHYAQAEHWLHLFLFALLFSSCIAAFAMLLGRLFKTRERGLQLLLVTSIPILFLSGYSWPMEALPPLLKLLGWLLPSTAGIHGFVGINQLGASLFDTQHEVRVLATLTMAFIALGLWLYRTRRSGGPTIG